MTNANKKTTLGSMTGFGIGQAADANGSLHIELRSVNSRFLELHFKIPDSLRHFEPYLRDQLSQSFKRGKVECRLSARGAAKGTDSGVLDEEKLLHLQHLQQRVLSTFPEAAPLTVAQILSFEGVQVEAASIEGRQHTLSQALSSAVVDLIAQRQREGERLAVAMLADLEQIELYVHQIEPRIGEVITTAQAKLTEKLTKVFKDVEQSQRVGDDEILVRIRQEVAALGLRADVAEELARLKSHCKEFRFCIEQGGPQGKRLDFLLQEFNREANTLGSKSINEVVTTAAIGLKQRIEQLREQVQNIE